MNRPTRVCVSSIERWKSSIGMKMTPNQTNLTQNSATSGSLGGVVKLKNWPRFQTEIKAPRKK